MKKQLLILFAFLAGSALLVVLLAALGQGQDSTSITDATDNLPPERTFGSAEMPITLVEYSDFECPACAAYAPSVKQLLKDFDGKIRFVYRYFPLSQIHPYARLTAQAAQAAALQGKFREMHDVLFAGQSVWAKSDSDDATKLMANYAAQIGLDMAQFAKDIDSDTVKAAVQNDYDRGTRIGIQGTPTFFLNGKSIKNPGNYEQFKAIIQAELDNR